MGLFSTWSEAEHRAERKKIANAFSLGQLLEMEARLDDCGRMLLQRMRGFAHLEKPMDLGSRLQHFSKPERWLTDTNEELAVMENGFFVFGVGSRSVLGALLV